MLYELCSVVCQLCLSKPGGGEIQFVHSFIQLTFSEGKHGSSDTPGIAAQ